MERETTRRVAVQCGEGLYREVTVKMVQEFHPTTRKLVKAKEVGREEGRLCRVVKEGEKATIQLVDAQTFDVVMLVEAATALPEKEVPPPTPTAEPKVSAPEPEPPATPAAAPKVAAPEPEPPAAPAAAPKVAAPEPEPPAAPAAAPGPAAATVADGAQPVVEEVEGPPQPRPRRRAKGNGKARPRGRLRAKAKAKAAKAKAAKAKAKKTSRKGNGKKAASGQSGKPLQLEAADLNPKEVIVLGTLSGGDPRTLKAMAEVFEGVPSRQANSWVRNALRRLVRGSLVEKVGKGTYRATDGGKEAVSSEPVG